MNALPEPRPTIILASASPRRRELLAQLGWDFSVQVPDVDEQALGEGIDDPSSLVRVLASAKASAIAKHYPEAVVIGADTVVACGAEILGKPTDTTDAIRMLSALQGTTHAVITGISAWHQGRNITVAESTTVTFAPMTPEAIAAYVASGEPMDKAGAYAIQGLASQWVVGITGCYFNVVGLPLHRLCTSVTTLLTH